MKKSLKKEALIQTATSLFYQHGFHAVGVKNILEQAQVASMTMYYHFQSKEELIKEVLVRREAKYLQLLEEKIDRKNGAGRYLDSLINAHIEWIDQEAANGCMFLRAKQEYSGVNEEIVALSTDHKKRLLAKIAADQAFFQASYSFSIEAVMILEGITSMAQVLDIETVKATALMLAKKMQLSS